MGLVSSVQGTVRVEIVSADIPGFMHIAGKAGIHLEAVQYTNPLSVRVTLQRREYKLLKVLANKNSAKLKLLRRGGVYWHAKGLLKRPFLLTGLAFLLFLSLYLPTRILFIEVEGNAAIPKALILEKAAQCGITFWASGRDVRSEIMKNSLLSAIPQLQWAGINTRGCTAVISVKERSENNPTELNRTVSSIVAARDGIIESFTATKGNALCSVGQAVKAGEVLISGYTDCGIVVKATAAEGEIIARTMHNISVATPLICSQKGEVTRTEKKYGLIIGKKRINFYKDSGISGTSCDKMYEEYYVTLPGGFQLPVALVVEKWHSCTVTTVTASAEDPQSVAEAYGQAYLLRQMISGQILEEHILARRTEELLVIESRYICREMIGRVHSEEISDSYGKDD